MPIVWNTSLGRKVPRNEIVNVMRRMHRTQNAVARRLHLTEDTANKPHDICEATIHCSFTFSGAFTFSGNIIGKWKVSIGKWKFTLELGIN